MLKIIYTKNSTFIFYDLDNDIIIKIGEISRKTNALLSYKHINIVKILKIENRNDNFFNQEIISVNEEWLTNFHRKHYYSSILYFEKLYSNIFKHPNKISVCGVEKIVGIDYSTCLSIKLSFLFQIIMVIKYLNIDLNICHSDLTDRNIWFKDHNDEIIDYGEYKILSNNFLLQLGDFGEVVLIKRKCSDLIFVISKILNQAKFYYLKSESLIYEEDPFDSFGDLFIEIYKSSETCISEENYNRLLSHDIFESIII